MEPLLIQEAHPLYLLGFCWSTTEDSSIYDFHQQQAYRADDFTINVTDLEPMETPLFGKVYAINLYDAGYGEQKEFQTGLCLLRDTLITMANGTSKMIQDILLLNLWIKKSK